MGSSILKMALPLAASYFLPGVGTALGTGLGFAEGAGASTIGSGLLGAGIGGLTGGGLKGALLGGLSGGIGANIGSLPNTTGGGVGSPGLGGLFDNLPASGGSGILGSIGSATGLTSNGLSSALPSLAGLVGGSGGGGSSFSGLGAIANLAGGLNQQDAIKKAQKQLLGSNDAQMANLETFDPSGITADPGYQFNLDQGQQGLNRSLAGQGSLFSGKALKAASEYNQNYADNAFNNYYQRWLNKTGAQNQLLGNQGAINSQGTMAGANGLASTLAGTLNPSGGLSSADLMKLLAKQQGTSLYG